MSPRSCPGRNDRAPSCSGSRRPCSTPPVRRVHPSGFSPWPHSPCTTWQASWQRRGRFSPLRWAFRTRQRRHAHSQQRSRGRHRRARHGRHRASVRLESAARCHGQFAPRARLRAIRRTPATPCARCGHTASASWPCRPTATSISTRPTCAARWPSAPAPKAVACPRRDGPGGPPRFASRCSRRSSRSTSAWPSASCSSKSHDSDDIRGLGSRES